MICHSGTRTIAGLAERVAVLQQVWSGEYETDTIQPVGPLPLTPGGPELLIGSRGPRTIRHAAHWADGLAGVSHNGDPADTAAVFDLARTAWADAGRPAPRLTTSLWFALNDGDGTARQRIETHLQEYLTGHPESVVDLMSGAGFAGTAAELRDVLAGFATIGTDELILTPAGADISQLTRVVEMLADSPMP